MYWFADRQQAMKTGVEKQRRRSIRLREYDYTQPGAYFITIVAHARAMLFAEISDGKAWLNEFGRIVENEWQKSAVIRREIGLDVFVVMPNHIHGIVNIIHADVGATGRSPLHRNRHTAADEFGRGTFQTCPCPIFDCAETGRV